MTDPRPLISVIIPVCNGASFIADAIGSVSRRGYRPLEIVVVDDGSTDSTPDVLRRLCRDANHDDNLRITTVRQSNRGPAAARNRGLEIARAGVIGFLDADDLWTGQMPTALHRRLIDDDLQVAVGCTRQLRVAAAKTGTAHLEPVGLVWLAFLLGASLFRRQVFEVVGSFDENMRFGEDVDWFLRAREAGIHIGISDDVVLLYRQHGNNMTRDTRQSDRYFLTALKHSLDRRRGAAGHAVDLAAVAELRNRGIEDFQPKESARPAGAGKNGESDG